MRFQDIKNAMEKYGFIREPFVESRCHLVEFWSPEPGARVLEVGCGRGFGTVVLGAAVGEAGRVLAVDISPPRESWKEFTSRIFSSPIGPRVTFQFSTDLLVPEVEFSEQSFDMVVFSHSSWFFSSPEILSALFKRVRPWAKRLGYAEKDPRIQDIRQLPTLLSNLMEAQLIALQPEGRKCNCHSLIIPSEARRWAEEAGWDIVAEKTSEPPKVDVRGNYIGGMRTTHEMADARMKTLSEYAQHLITSEIQLIKDIAANTGSLKLPEYAFVAQ